MQANQNAFQPIGDLDCHGVEGHAAYLLKVRELSDLETVKQNLPTDPPRAEGRGFPVVFFKADVVLFEVDTDGAKALQVEILHVHRRRLEDYLKLGMLV